MNFCLSFVANDMTWGNSSARQLVRCLGRSLVFESERKEVMASGRCRATRSVLIGGWCCAQVGNCDWTESCIMAALTETTGPVFKAEQRLCPAMRWGAWSLGVWWSGVGATCLVMEL